MRNQTKTRKNIDAVCEVCGKSAVVANNRPHSLHKTKRIVKPNIQKNQGRLICTRCLRTQAKKA